MSVSWLACSHADDRRFSTSGYAGRVRDRAEIVQQLIAWFGVHARDLPWRHNDPWAVMVSEFMLQQTPVSRVLPLWQAWLERWPTPAALAAEQSSEAVRAWGRLGYPRRALRLHASATAITERHGGQVPDRLEELLALPGVGDYTAAAIASFAFGAAVPVLDTNVRRVLTRLEVAEAVPAASLTKAERARAQLYTDAAGQLAPRWAAAVMEFGALVCLARRPRCASCPVAHACAWRAAGHPLPAAAARPQSWHGSDRQCRGALLDVVRRSPGGVPTQLVLDSWHLRAQAEACLAALEADGLVHRTADTVTL